MPVYEFECGNPKCIEDNKPYEFELFLPLREFKLSPQCPKCHSNIHVKKVIRTAFPKSNSWGT